MSFLHLFISCILHETAHILTCILCKVKLSSLRFTLAGIRIKYCPSVISYKKELAVILSGCFVSLILAIVSYLFHFQSFVITNIAVFLFNILPIHGLDGGEALKIFCKIRFSDDAAEKISHTVSLFTLILLWLFVTFYNLRIETNVSLLVVCVFLLVRSLLR